MIDGFGSALQYCGMEQLRELKMDELQVEALLDRDNRAWRSFAALHGTFIFSVLLQVLASQDDAKDCYQDVMISLMSGFSTYEANRPLRPWLRTVARNCALKFLKRRLSVDTVTADEELLPSDQRQTSITQLEEAERNEEIRALRKAIADLSDNQYVQVFLMKMWQGMSDESIAIAIGIAKSSVRSYLLRGRRSLGQRLRYYYPDL